MKKTTSLLLFSLVLWLVTASTVQAQTNLGSLLGQLDSAQRAAYLRNLDSLGKRFNSNSLALDPAIDSLNRAMLGRNPLAGVDSLGFFTGALDSFFRMYRPTDSLGIRDRDTILGEYARLKKVSIPFADSLNGLFGKNQGNLLSSTGVPVANYPLDNSLWKNGEDSLGLNLKNQLKAVPAKGLGGFAPVLGQLFNKNNFKLELFSGMQSIEVAYFSLRQSLQLPVIGLRTVEQFNSLWETRWQMQGSWNTTDVKAVAAGEKVFVAQEAKSPELLQMEFAAMFNPGISIFSNSNRSVRLISSLGIEVSTYAPAHRNLDASSLKNKGFATGVGPQMGAGFALSTGAFTTFALGTMSYGNVICKAENANGYIFSPYTFFSTCITAGVRYGNAFTMRYEIRSNDWGSNQKNNPGYAKNARTNQITVGIPISGLTR